MDKPAYEALYQDYVATHDVLGCTEEEVAGLKRTQGVQLPDDYRRFLILMGRKANIQHLVGSDYSFSQLNDLQEWGNELLAECQLPELPEGAFVIAMHQGYQFYFLWEGAVYYFLEGNSKFEKRFDSFTDWFCFFISIEENSRE